jgi:hypothetical protein
MSTENEMTKFEQMNPECGNDRPFGCCPECGECAGPANVGRNHFFYCEKHRMKWNYGSNVFSSWRYETEEEQIANYDRIDLGNFREVECCGEYPWPKPTAT